MASDQNQIDKLRIMVELTKGLLANGSSTVTRFDEDNVKKSMDVVERFADQIIARCNQRADSN